MTFNPRHIFVPVAAGSDGEAAYSRAPLAAAAALASAFGAKITLYCVGPNIAPLVGDHVDAMTTASYGVLRKALEVRVAVLQARMQTLADEVDGDVEIVVDTAHDEPIPNAVITAALASSADLIVLSSHARKGLSRFMLGSVADKIAHLSPLPVMLLKPGETGAPK